MLKQNRGSAGEGIWLCWIANEAKDGIIPETEYPAKAFGDCSLPGDKVLKLMEMNDNHVEYRAESKLQRTLARPASMNPRRA